MTVFHILFLSEIGNLSIVLGLSW